MSSWSDKIIILFSPTWLRLQNADIDKISINLDRSTFYGKRKTEYMEVMATVVLSVILSRKETQLITKSQG